MFSSFQLDDNYGPLLLRCSVAGLLGPQELERERARAHASAGEHDGLLTRVKVPAHSSAEVWALGRRAPARAPLPGRR